MSFLDSRPKGAKATAGMPLSEHAELLGPHLFAAIERKGYAELTAVQRAVLDPALAGRDLRITSQTGSGKTLAIGLTLRTLANEEAPPAQGKACPRALIVAPTRELAHQVERELTWLYSASGLKLATTTGGTSYRDEHRALSKGPDVVVGTPGRLLDHLERGTIDPSRVSTVVLDEADRMLDLGFRDDLERLFETVPAERSTHLVSATFPRVVRNLADRLQRDPAHVEGTRLGEANADIEHVIYVVDPAQRLDALINLLLAHPNDQTLVFVRTRADTAHIANALVVNGFAASGLSGEMEQAARNRTLAAFKSGGLRVLIATDVAARGIDVQDVARVVHGELPTNADAYTHRAGRTGRAGRKGTSALLVTPAGVVHATRLLRGLGADHRIEPIPSAEEIVRADDARLFAELTDESVDDVDARWDALAKRLAGAGALERTLTRLLARANRGVTAPRDVRVFPRRDRLPPPSAAKPVRERGFQKRDRDRERAPEPFASGPRSFPKRDRVQQPTAAERAGAAHEVRRSKREREPEQSAVELAVATHEGRTGFKRGPKTQGHRSAESVEPVEAPKPAAAPDEARPAAKRERVERVEQAGNAADPREKRERRPHPSAAKREGGPREDAGAFTSFHVSWGQRSGADARRLLAMVCRRGEIRGRDVGAIRVEPNFSLVQVSSEVAPAFARAASRPDPREPEVVIRLDRAASAAELSETREKVRRLPPPRGRAAGSGGHAGQGGHGPLKRKRAKR